MSEKTSPKKVLRPRGIKRAVRAGAAAVSARAQPKLPLKGFPIVGLGASAGGLEALEEFFSHVPPLTGMAFVVVTHQHPGHTSLLPELLGKHTRMPVVEARDGQRVEPNCVYLSRAESHLAMLNGALRLVEFKEHDGLRLPIDYFFRSLAEDQRERAVGIILSGTGTDGTLGLKAIKGAAGMAMAQEPESAKYPGMPQSAIATSLVDFVLRPEQMPARLASYLKGPYLLPPESTHLTDLALPEPLQKIIFLLRTRTRHDFSAYKPTTIRRRIERRMNLHQVKGPLQYLQYLQDNPHELDLLFRELLIGVTNFFRDPEAFALLTQEALPKLLKARPDDSVLRVWVPGCSTGEEAYSLAITLREAVEALKRRLTIQIFGTDLDNEAIDIARAGLYPGGIAVDVPAERLARHFIQEDGSYRIRKAIREMVVFAPQNVLKDPPFTRLDLVSCRNLLIYLKADAQKRLLALFHYALRPGGLMFLGPSESIGEFTDQFAALDKHWKIFTRKETVVSVHPLLDFPARPAEAAARPDEAAAPADRNREPQAIAAFEKLLVKRFAPASVIINGHGDILHIHGRTGDYLEPSSGQPRLNLLEMAREGLRLEVAAALRRAAAGEAEAVQEGVRVKSNGGFISANVVVSRVTEPEAMRGLFLVTFRPLAVPVSRPATRPKVPSKKAATQVEELERELLFTRESLQSTVEELKSTNEELQSTNEELQSTNEELETSREEMQSLNEELQTVNAQLQSKVEALSDTNDDMQNLLNSTSIATIFLDRQLRIKRFTEQAKMVIALIPSDVGRPIGDLVSNLNYDHLPADAAEVLRTLHFKECEVQTKQGGWRLVRVLPYRTAENLIDGLVITCIDINRLKAAEQAAQEARNFAESIVATVREPMLVLDAELRVVSASPAFCRFFRMTRAEVEQHLLYELGRGQWNIPRLRQLLERILPRNNAFESFEMTHTFSRIGRRVLLLNARRLKSAPHGSQLILLAMEDVTDRRGKTRRKKSKVA